VRLLLDTHALLWWVTDAPDLSRRARAAIAAPGNECLVSAATAWELAIKVSLGRLEVSGGLERFLAEQLAVNRFRALPIEVAHAVRVARLPFHHRDPFDRLLAAQALEEGAALVSADKVLSRYGVRRIW
jgi:PIN domain nuclease of toxin-antitoxin system